LGKIAAFFDEEKTMRRSLVVGNWKLNGSSELVAELLAGLKAEAQQGDFADTAVCPPLVYLSQALVAVEGCDIQLGAQDVSLYQTGAYTGEVSAAMLSDLACRFVIVGHSERRSLFAEDDQVVAQKFIAAVQAGLTPILCLGESLGQRESGEALPFVGRQLKAVIDAAGVDALKDAVVAYEPIWAIGTGKTASPDQAQEVHAHLRTVVALESEAVAESLQILYGGSVNSANAVELFAKPDIDGALVGGASLKVEGFSIICRAANQ
jgi:triosephosphate isomerase